MSRRTPSRGPAPREAPVWNGADLNYDPAPALVGLRVPVLVLLGEDDESTPAAETAARIRTALGRAPTRDVTIEILPGADHGLFATSTGESWDWPRPSPGWVEAMEAWIVTRVPRAPR